MCRPWTEVGTTGACCPALHAGSYCLEGDVLPCQGVLTGVVGAQKLVPVSLTLCCRSMVTLHCSTLTPCKNACALCKPEDLSQAYPMRDFSRSLPRYLLMGWGISAVVPVWGGCFSRCIYLSSTNREEFRQIGVGAKPWEELFYSLPRVVVLWKHLQLQGLYGMPLGVLGSVAAVCWAGV